MSNEPGPLEKAARRSRDLAGVASPEGLGENTRHVLHIDRARKRAVVAVCSCGWTSRPARLASKAVADWKKHNSREAAA